MRNLSPRSRAPRCEAADRKKYQTRSMDQWMTANSANRQNPNPHARRTSVAPTVAHQTRK